MPNEEQISHEVNSRRPGVLEQFVGQQGVVERIKVAFEAAWQDSTRLPHMLFTGPPGTGKSQLAEILAKEMGCELRQQLGQNLNWIEGLNGFLLEPEDKQILFIDEIHELMPGSQTALYRAMEERRLFIQPDSMMSNKRKEIVLADFTLIAATTDEFSLLRPLLDRFKIVAHFQKYTPQELELLLMQRCRMLGWSVEQEVLLLIAERGRGVPRLALRLLEAVHRTSRAEGANKMTAQHLNRTCALERLNKAGLNELEQRYLAVLKELGGTLRLNVIAARLGLPVQTIQKNVETCLIEEGYIEKGDGGARVLTEKGFNASESRDV